MDRLYDVFLIGVGVVILVSGWDNEPGPAHQFVHDTDTVVVSASKLFEAPAGNIQETRANIP